MQILGMEGWDFLGFVTKDFDFETGEFLRGATHSLVLSRGGHDKTLLLLLTREIVDSFRRQEVKTWNQRLRFEAKRTNASIFRERSQGRLHSTDVYTPTNSWVGERLLLTL